MDNQKIEKIGARDLPLARSEKDLLDTKNYIDALVDFTIRCWTPMSIALQGDWGTGKTSFINMMQSRLDKIGQNQISEQPGAQYDNAIHTIYFNTWQYSQFNSSEDLYTSFLVCLMESLCSQVDDANKKKKLNEKAKKVLTFIASVTVDIAAQYVKNTTRYDLGRVTDGVDALVTKVTEKNKKITELKKNFADLIAEASGDNGRVIIFIDDLDRLNPEVAVALLETIKLFMDVEKCVFVLAIDYDVVVRGIRKKYGSDMDDIKCRSFFDKIIQLPFRMPTEKYMIKNMIEETSVGDKIKEYTDVICNLIKETLGPNPRTLKRVINSFELLSLVAKNEREEKGEEYKNALLMVSLVMQIYDEKQYSEMLENIDDVEVFSTYREAQEKADELRQGDKYRSIIPFFQAIDKVGEKCKKSQEEINKEFINSLGLSAMTTVVSEIVAVSQNGKKHNVDRVVLFGESQKVDTPTEAIRETVTSILENKEDKFDEVIKKYEKTLTLDPNASTSMFAAKSKLDIKGKQPVYLAIKTNYEQKIAFIRKICEELDVSNEIQWYDGDKELLWQK